MHIVQYQMLEKHFAELLYNWTDTHVHTYIYIIL